MKYKFYSFLLLILVSLFAFKAEVTTTPRTVLLGQLDSLELEIQQRRRTGKPIDKIEEEIARLKWTIEESKSDTTQISDSLTESITSADIVQNSDGVKPEKNKEKNSVELFFKEHSTLDIMIIVVGAIAALAIVLLALFLLYIKLFKKGQSVVKVASKPTKSIKSKRVQQKKEEAPQRSRELSAREKRDTLEEIKSKLSALNDRHNKEQLQERIRPAEELPRRDTPSRIVDDEFENPFQRVAESDASMAENPFAAAKTISDLSKQPTLGHPGIEPELLPEQTLMEETLEEKRRETMSSSVESVSERPLSLNEKIVASFDSGDDVVTIAQKMNMSIDQIKMILRISGR